jgi:hypothetical protein
LCCTPREAKKRVTSAEFAEYEELFRRLDKKEHETKKWEYYAASLIAETRRSWVSKPQDVKNDLFLMEYKEVTPAKELTPEEKEVQAANQLAMEKATWAIVAGKTKARSPKRKPRHVR